MPKGSPRSPNIWTDVVRRRPQRRGQHRDHELTLPADGPVRPSGSRRSPSHRRRCAPSPSTAVAPVRASPDSRWVQTTRVDTSRNAARAASRRAAASGLRLAQRAGTGGPLGGSDSSAGPGFSRAVCNAASQVEALRRCLRPPKIGRRNQIVEGLRVGGRGVDDCRVGQDAPRCDVTTLGDFVTHGP